MAQSKEFRGTARHIRQDGHKTIYSYHRTDIVTVDPNQAGTSKAITLNSGGWRTPTTKLAMNQASNQFGLGFQVYQHNHDWYVDAGYPEGVLPFHDGMVIYT